MSSTARRVVVAGAGAVGSAIAFGLARRGASVIWVDPAAGGDNASGVAAGMLAPAFETVLEGGGADGFALLGAARDRWTALTEALDGAEVGLWRGGALWVDLPDFEGPGAGDLATRFQAIGAACEVVAAETARSFLPSLPADLTGALYTPEDWSLDPLLALAGLREAAIAAGAAFVREQVVGFGDGVARLSDGRHIVADALVLATGMGAGPLTPIRGEPEAASPKAPHPEVLGAARRASKNAAVGQVRPSRPATRAPQDEEHFGRADETAGDALAPELAHLSPIKGHILRQALAPRQSGGPILRGAGGYVSATAGGVHVGSTMEPGVSDRAVDAGAVDRLKTFGERLYPALVGADLKARTGVRAATPDGLPLVGPSATPGVLLAVGMRRNGWLLAPLVAEMIAAYLTGDNPGPYGARLNPRRFEAQ